MSWWKNLFSGSTSDNQPTLIASKINEETNKDLDIALDIFRSEHRFNSNYDTLLFLFITLVEELIYYNSQHDLPTDPESLKIAFDNRATDKLLTLYEHGIKVYPMTRYETIIKHIYDYAKFLIIADAMLLYNNDNSENIYSVSESDSTIKLMLTFDEFNIGYCFTTDIAKKNDKNMLEDYIEILPRVDDVLVYIEVKRNNIAGTKTNYTCTIGKAVQFKEEEYQDRALFNCLLNNTTQAISESYNQILNNSFSIYTGLKVDNFDWMEFLYGFRIRNNPTE